MTAQEIKNKLASNHENFIEALDKLNEKDFMFSLNGKWTAGQQMDHIYKSVAPLAKALWLPKFLLSYKFGKANRPSKDYDALVQKYLGKLNAGGVAPSPFLPPPVPWSYKKPLEDKLRKTVAQLCKRVDSYNEEQLDKYILPHPLLGKLTIREMLYFTAYHVEHHQQITFRNLGR